MKHRKNIFATLFALILVVSIIATSAAASAKDKDNSPVETMPEIVSVDSPADCDVPSLEDFVRNLDSLTEQEKSALVRTKLVNVIAELAKFEKQIDDIYARMTDENANKLYDEISDIDDKITDVLERNSALWERVNDKYDENIAANEADMAF